MFILIYYKIFIHSGVSCAPPCYKDPRDSKTPKTFQHLTAMPAQYLPWTQKPKLLLVFPACASPPPTSQHVIHLLTMDTLRTELRFCRCPEIWLAWAFPLENNLPRNALWRMLVISGQLGKCGFYLRFQWAPSPVWWRQNQVKIVSQVYLGSHVPQCCEIRMGSQTFSKAGLGKPGCWDDPRNSVSGLSSMELN